MAGIKGLDIVLGIITGMTFQPLVTFSVCDCLHYLIISWYRVPKPPDDWYSVWGCFVALTPIVLIWSRLRLFYRTLANSALWSCMFFGCLILWFSYFVATDTGPPILPR